MAEFSGMLIRKKVPENSMELVPDEENFEIHLVSSSAMGKLKITVYVVPPVLHVFFK